MIASTIEPGQRIGRWTVLSSAPRRRGEAYWTCVCVCGTTREVRGSPLRSGLSQSCGCRAGELTGERFRMHGARASGNQRTKEYVAWINAKDRCENPNCRQYSHYGARGIFVAEEWRHDFPRFLRDMGPAPSRRHSLDRIDNDGPYGPGNCRWATWSEQARNRRAPRTKARSGVRGVVIEPSGRFSAHVSAGRRHVLLGTFDTITEADEAARAGRRRYLSPTWW